MSTAVCTVSADEALRRLKEGNERYMSAVCNTGDISPEIRERSVREGQHPYAIIICCSDSRVIPESIFSAGIGELFVIRVAGNVIDNHQLGSIEYAAEHLGCKLVVMLGHDHCGAVDAALNHDPSGYIKYITDSIKNAVGNEKDALKACWLNARNGARMIEENIDINHMEHDEGLKVICAVYRTGTGKVEFSD